MLENEAKGSFGAFSSIGRITAETFINIKRKDKILNPKKNTGNKQIIINFLKRNKYQNIEGDAKEEEVKEPNEGNLDDSEIEDLEEESDIFNINEEEIKKKKRNLSKNKKKKEKDLFTCYHRTNEDAYKFHDLHMNKKKEKSTFSTPNCTKYFPNKDFVWHRMPTCPKWETMESRKPLAKKSSGGSYLCHEDPLKNITNCFINMDKQTMRGDVINSNNVRINTAKPFISKNKKNKSVREFDKILNDSTNSYKMNLDRIKSGKDYNKKRNLEMNNKWKTQTNYNDIKTLKTISTLENQKVNDNINEKEKESRKNNQVLTTELTDSANILNINTNIMNSTDNNKSYISFKKENKFEDDKNEFHTENSDYESSESEDSYHQFKNLYAKQLKSHQKKDNLPKLTSENSKHDSMFINNNSTSVKSKLTEKNKKRPKTTKVKHRTIIKGPEFDKIIPREYYDNLADNGLSLIPFSINNYTQVRERPLSVVTYKRKPIFKRTINNFKGMEIDQYKKTSDYTNHKCYVPIFNKMNTRPLDDGTPLPVFMKGVVSRDGCNITTDSSLKMNYFADGKIRGNYNTFLPKKSYNKIINLNLMNSNALIDYLVINKKEAFQNNDNIIKSLKFYSKNFKDLLKETSSSKFDNITYKTIKNKYDDYIKDLKIK